jgi:hypothetical protein
MYPLPAAVLARHDPPLPDTLYQGDILAENGQGSNDRRQTLEDGQEEPDNSYE